ncbi:MAG: shikimate dehydrogenase [Pyrinomonadaceae bacterium]
MNEAKHPRICVPICVSHARDLPQMLERAAHVADIIELRLDCLDGAQFDTALQELGALLHANVRPLILTFRPAEQGGQRALDFFDRVGFWSSGWRSWYGGKNQKPELVDIELDLLDSCHVWKFNELIEQQRVICSHHDFVGIPADLVKIYERMAATSARILKIAVQADEITDCIPIFQLLERARLEGREMIAIAMGEAGVATRILAPSRGAFLTYGAQDEAHQTAPGQLSAKDLRELYRVHQLNERTDITGLIGAPVAHSVSPHMHNAAFAARKVNAVYVPFEVRNLEAFIRRMAHPRTRELVWNLRGLSVTAPHKSEVLNYLDWIEPSAREIGAVNTIVFEDDALHGYNTDADAFLAPLKNMIGDLRDARCAVIGAGGASRGVLWSLRHAGANATVFARNEGRAQKLAEQFSADARKLDGANFKNFDAVINATPLGTRGTSENETPAVASQLEGASIAYDLVYNPHETCFLREARHGGCKVIGGLQMLVDQAAAQFELWTKETAPQDVMREAAEKQLNSLA